MSLASRLFPMVTRPANLLPLLALVCGLAWADFALRAADPTKDKGKPSPPSSDDAAELTLPDFWPEGHPLPQVKSNCVKCHLNAGRELTVPLVHFAHSVHDLNQMSCHDCHGGNTVDDAKAHEEDFGFIGTKLSAHIARCAECHEEQADVLAAGPHHWDWSKRINIDYPMCFDCHGNHDVGNAAADFKLKEICLDCHENLDQDYPHVASFVTQNDELAETLAQVREKHAQADELLPEKFADEVGSLREATMRVLHAARELTADEAQQLGERAAQTRERLETWLKKSK
ncbi:MAG: cytochrome c3 family protein [Pirellulales bacterium]|nr:cytochrome c3 family protein [Pirellulales bacterium]